ncbi:MAG: glycosyltransferase, partial [Lachnospiraceae bacterium]|nr:glycosyltransferase [Lachnospiraceae bacterium]
MNNGFVDVVVLTYKPDMSFFDQIAILQRQTVRPNKILIMNTEEKYLRSLLYGTRFMEENPNVEIHHVSKKEFNHGKTRNRAAQLSGADFLIFMTQDAMPVNENLIEELLKPMSDEKVAVSYARQLAGEEAGPIERYNRLFNYPEEDRVQTEADIAERGIKAFFCSDVCACYRKEVFERLGGFIRYTIFNEDMLYAYSAIRAGEKVFYASRAQVCHFHNYTAKQQYSRNFDLGVSHADHPEVFQGLN